MNRYMLMRRLVCVACFIPLLAACIIPTPIPLGSEVTVDDIEKIEPGVTHRYQIEAQLGQPNILDEDGFAVYQLREGMLNVFFIDRIVAREADETYNLAFAYDNNGVVKEFRYDKTVRRDNADLVMLEQHFPDQSVEIGKGKKFWSIDISGDGSRISAVSKDGYLLHDLWDGGMETRRVDQNLYSSNSSDECLQKIKTIVAQKNTSEYDWLLSSPDKTPFYRSCNPTGSLDISEDGTLLALSNNQTTTLWDLERGVVQARHSAQDPISRLTFSPDNKFLISVENGKTIHFKEPTIRYASRVNLWSLPNLNHVASLDREKPVLAIAISNDGKYFALATRTHIELWARAQNSDVGWPFKFKRLLPKPALPPSGSQRLRYDMVPDGVLRFSPDGKYLMNADGLLQLWDTHSGKLLARIGNETGSINAAFHNNEEILVLRSVRIQLAWSPPYMIRYKAARLWRLSLDTVISQYGDIDNPTIVPVSNLGLQPVEKVSPAASAVDSTAFIPKSSESGDETAQLTAADWRALIAGNTATAKAADGTYFFLYFSPDGRMDGKSGNSWDSGTWEVTEDGRYCRDWKKWLNGTRDCYAMNRLGNNRFHFKAIRKPYEYTFSLLPGDPEKLELK